MNFIGAAIFILLFAIISVPIANRARLPLEVFLVIGSCIISLIPGVSSVAINPQLIFSLFLPPILFYAAYFTSWNEFKLNLRPISLLAFGLVLFTMSIVAIAAKNFFPTLSWAECFLLGSIVSPTDAVSASALVRKLGAPRRIVTILEGESLINDATALVAFRFSLTAIITGSFSLPQASTQFVVMAGGGVLVGLIIAKLAALILKKIKSSPAETTLTFLTALTSYLIADQLHLSGVISVVTSGIYFGLHFPEITTSRTRLNAKASWDTLFFIVNGFLFALIGLELPNILKNLPYHTFASLILYGVIISSIIMVSRIFWVFVVAHLSRLLFPFIARRDPTPHWTVLFILGWCGMRGIVSLAAALSLPIFISTNTLFPHRELILVLTYYIIVVSLMVPAFTLPFFLRKFNMIDSENKMQQEALARIRSLEGIVEKLCKIKVKEKIPDEIFNEYRKQIERRMSVIKTQLNEQPFSTLNNEYQSIKKLTIVSIESERMTLFQLRKIGEINDDVFHMLLEELDLEELRVKTIRV